MADEQCIIIDNGSGTLKVGFANNTNPLAYIPPIFGQPRDIFREELTNSIYYGQDVQDNLNKMTVSHLVDHGHIDDFDKMEVLWRMCFDRIDSISDGASVLLTEPLNCSSNHKKCMLEIFFEKLNVEELNCSLSGLLAMYGTGKTTGTVVDIGDGITQVVPMQAGYLDPNCVRRIDFGGSELTMYLQRLLCQGGYLLTSRSDYELVKTLKEKYCFCSLDPIQDEKNGEGLEITHMLPDGQMLRDEETDSISMGVERFYVCEALFNPSIANCDTPNLPNVIWDAIQACSIEERTLLTESIHLCGGCGLFKNLDKRLQFELKNMAPAGARDKVTVLPNDNCHLLAWKGATFFSQYEIRAANPNRWITAREWEESGPDILACKTL
ncbi:bifunctional Actin family/ATPase [Babesia duncani]|uniref:Bifunctional Actin family/ATPase n=1 Tax=Babesia duncani TaxID=323732 RepID=A0AAD9PL66_9APIC|nr:bifunctional Actin family/ATPase [Babesia duncani]